MHHTELYKAQHPATVQAGINPCCQKPSLFTVASTCSQLPVLFLAAGPVTPAANYYTLSVPSPSSIGRHELKNLQAMGDHGQQLQRRPLLLNFRPGYAQPLPLQLMHPCIAHFVQVFNWPEALPDRRDNTFLVHLANISARFFSCEDDRQQAVIGLLQTYLRVPFVQQPQLEWFRGCGREKPDAAVSDGVSMECTCLACILQLQDSSLDFGSG